MYAQMVADVMDKGKPVNPRGTKTLELHPAVIEVENPRRRLVTAHGRPVNVAFALAEALWILAGRNDVEMPAYYNSNVKQFSDDGIVFNAAYGNRLRRHFGHDQIEDVIKVLAADRDSRQATLVISSPRDDRGWLNGIPHAVKDRACNVLSHLLIREGALDWVQVVRSNDLLWGTPYNWMQFTHLQEYIAQRLGVPVGKYYHFADSLHIYNWHWEEAKQVRPFNLYEWLNYDHPVMDADQQAMEIVYVNETDIRTGDDWFPDDNVGEYWLGVLQVLWAHRLYKQQDNTDCLIALCNADTVYGAAQARFYWHSRWHKATHRHTMGRMIELEFRKEVAQWIMTDPLPSPKVTSVSTPHTSPQSIS